MTFIKLECNLQKPTLCVLLAQLLRIYRNRMYIYDIVTLHDEILSALGVGGGGACSYLLWTRACSTLVVLSEGGVPAEFWLITDRNFSSSLVLSVFPAPLSPLKNKTRDENSLKGHFFFSLSPELELSFFFSLSLT